MAVPPSEEHALQLDADDELARFREEFVIDDPELIYLDGNSLGRMPTRARARLQQVIDHEWGRRLIRGWNEGWFEAPQRIGGKIAGLVGAGPDEVIVADSTSVNLFKLIVSALQTRPDRSVIVTDELNFPSDVYVLQGALDLLGNDYELRIVRSDDGVSISERTLAEAIDEDTALVALSHVLFKSGFVHDMASVTLRAHEVGALVLWDLSHSVGAMPIALDACDADLAVGCSYKYLNGGPGAPAFLYVHKGRQTELANPIQGWFGQQNLFDFALDYSPAEGITRFLTGTPPVLSLSGIEAGVELLLEAGLDRLRAKSVRQTEYLIELWDAFLRPLGFTLNSPREAERRGSHVSLGHADALRIDRALIEEMKVLPDFRYPDNIRLGIAPIYTSFLDIYEAVQRIRRTVTERRYEKYSDAAGVVT